MAPPLVAGLPEKPSRPSWLADTAGLSTTTTAAIMAGRAAERGARRSWVDSSWRDIGGPRKRGRNIGTGIPRTPVPMLVKPAPSEQSKWPTGRVSGAAMLGSGLKADVPRVVRRSALQAKAWHGIDFNSAFRRSVGARKSQCNCVRGGGQIGIDGRVQETRPAATTRKQIPGRSGTPTGPRRTAQCKEFDMCLRWGAKQNKGLGDSSPDNPLADSSNRW